MNRIDRVRSYDMADSLRQEDVLESVLRRQKKWMRKMEEMSEEMQCMWGRCQERRQERDCKNDGTGR